MKNKLVILAIINALTVFTITAAQAPMPQPQLIVTWQVQNYQPADYKGKNLPTFSSPVIAAIELINNDKLVNLAPAQIIWSQNTDVLVVGAGLKRIAFNANDLIGNRLLLKAEINFPEKTQENGIIIPKELRGQSFSAAAIIPVVEPKAVIAASHVFNQEIKTGAYNFKAMPFFFNIKGLSELLFTWSVNEQQETVGQNPDVLNLEITSENPNPVTLNLTAAISNINNIIEAAKDEIRFILTP